MELKVEGPPKSQVDGAECGGEKDRDVSSSIQAWECARNSPSSERLAAASVPSHHYKGIAG